MIEESDGDETKNQVGASPEPDFLMKHVEYDDSNNEQDVLHGGEKVSSPFGECQGPQKSTYRILDQIHYVPLVLFCGLTTARAHRLKVMRIDVVTLDHAIESLAIDGQHTCRGLLVAVRMLQHTRNVTSLDYG